MILPAAFLSAGLILGGPPERPGAPSLSWPRILPPEEVLQAGDEPGPALMEYRPGRKSGSIDRFQTVFAVSLPFSFLWSYGLLRGAESLQGMDKEEGKAFEKKYLVLSAAAGGLAIAAADYFWSRGKSRRRRAGAL